MSSHRMLILGGTGEVGRQAVAAALADARVSHVLSFGRRPPPVPADAPGHEKLQHTSLDFDALLAEVRQGYDGSEAKKLSGSDADSVVIALGTTRANAGSAEAFELIDREYVLAAAKAARVPEKTQTVVYVSVSTTRRSFPGRFSSSNPSRADAQPNVRAVRRRQLKLVVLVPQIEGVDRRRNRRSRLLDDVHLPPRPPSGPRRSS
jgi:uncharacterized protein YbjT (DUF2867 family)